MNIKELAAKAKLIKITLDDEDIVEQYGEALEFWVWDRQPLDKFLQFAGKDLKAENYPELVKFCSELILDEDGKPVMADDMLLPNVVLAKCVTKVVEQLGK